MNRPVTFVLAAALLASTPVLAGGSSNKLAEKVAARVVRTDVSRSNSNGGGKQHADPRLANRGGDRNPGKPNDNHGGNHGQPGNNHGGNHGQPGNNHGGNHGQPGNDHGGNHGQPGNDHGGNHGQPGNNHGGNHGQPGNGNGHGNGHDNDHRDGRHGDYRHDWNRDGNHRDGNHSDRYRESGRDSHRGDWDHNNGGHYNWNTSNNRWDRYRSDWNHHPNYWDNRRHDRVDYARYRFHHGRYSPPRGYYHRVWYRGSYLPRAWYGSSYIVHDYNPYHLYAPPYGYQWVRVGNDVLLTALATGLVLDVLYDIWY